MQARALTQRQRVRSAGAGRAAPWLQQLLRCCALGTGCCGPARLREGGAALGNDTRRRNTQRWAQPARHELSTSLRSRPSRCCRCRCCALVQHVVISIISASLRCCGVSSLSVRSLRGRARRGGQFSARPHPGVPRRGRAPQPLRLRRGARHQEAQHRPQLLAASAEYLLGGSHQHRTATADDGQQVFGQARHVIRHGRGDGSQGGGQLRQELRLTLPFACHLLPLPAELLLLLLLLPLRDDDLERFFFPFLCCRRVPASAPTCES